MGDERFTISEIIGDVDQFEGIEEAECVRFSPCQGECDERSPARHLLAGNGIIGMVGEMGVEDMFDAR